ncbi:unnamed protein product [Caenorhabditis brenneri]
MSLSRPARFPLLKLPYLCSKCVLHNLDEFLIIYFATISDRTRRIVRSSNYPLKTIDVGLREIGRITIKYELGNNDNKLWYFMHDKYAYGSKISLRKNSQALRTSRHFDSRGHYLESYTTGDELDSLKMGIEFMIDVFGCTVRQVFVHGDKISDLSGLGIRTVKELFISDPGPDNITDLKYLLETIKVTDRYVFHAPIPANFYCDPRIFKCRKLFFGCRSSADWVTFEVLCQFDVPQLNFSYHRFSVEDVVFYVNHWFNSENRKLEYLHIAFNNPISLEDFKIDHLNPMPFCEKRRSRRALHEPWWKTDMSNGKDILRQDGLLATLYAYSSSIFFYVWHKRFPDVVE